MGAPYISQAVSGYNASPPPDDSTQVAANKITWNTTIKQKLADPLNTFIAAVNSQLVTWSDFSSVTTSTNLTTTTAHHMQTIEVTSGSPTIQLGDAATMTKNYTVTVTNTGTGAPVIALATAGNTLDGTAAGTFTFPTGTKTSFTFKVNNGATGYYTEVLGGKTILAQTSVITPIVDSGSTGALSLKTNNGTTQVSIANSGLVEFTGNIDIQGAVIGTNSGQSALTINTGQIGNNAFTQLQVLHTASSNRNVTITGSNGGNPTISTTAGSLAITPALVTNGGITPTFDSGEQAVTSSSDLSVAHSLSRIPAVWKIILRNKTTELGYSVNDEVDITNGRGWSSYVNSTNIGTVNDGTLQIVNRTTKALAAITTGNWKLLLRAW